MGNARARTRPRIGVSYPTYRARARRPAARPARGWYAADVGLPLSTAGPKMLGRYALFEAFASGGMATVHLGRDMGQGGRTVAIKRLHAQFVNDPEFVTMFLDEARLAACVRHPNVVAMLDIVTLGREPFLVMDYVQGESLSRLIRSTRDRGMLVPGRIVASVMAGALHGLHAAHDARSETGELLGLIHRDVSPHNVLVGADGYARMVDFGVAKASGREQHTRAGQLKGKLSYMAPEQARLDVVNRQTDIYAAAVVMWEALTGQRLYFGETDGAILARVIEGRAEPPSQVVQAAFPNIDAGALYEIRALDPVVMRGLAFDPSRRFPSAYDMAMAIEQSIRFAPPGEVGAWVSAVATDAMHQRAHRIVELESGIEARDRYAERDSETGIAPAGILSGAYPVQQHTVAMHSPVQASAAFLETLTLQQAPPDPSAMPPRAPARGHGTAHTGVDAAPHVLEPAPARPLPPQANFDARTGMTPSQLSSISVSTPSRVVPPPKPPRRWGLIGALSAVCAFMLAAALIVGLAALRRHQARAAAGHPPPPSTLLAAPPPAPTSPPPVSTTPAADVTPPAPPATLATPSTTTAATLPAPPTTAAQTAAAPSPPAPKPPPAPRTPAPPPRRPQTAPVSDECKPPYVVDPDGVRHYKAACL